MDEEFTMEFRIIEIPKNIYNIFSLSLRLRKNIRASKRSRSMNRESTLKRLPDTY